MRAPSRTVPIILAGLVGLAVPPSGASEERKAETPKMVAQATAAVAKSATPVYKPPLRGAPGGRVGGGTRGVSGRDLFVLSVLAPDHTGFTVNEQPTLYWFISADTSLPVEFAISDPNAIDPLLEIALPSPVKRGVHRVRLADHGVTLAPGIAYRWSVTVVADSNRRARDILASGMVERMAPPDELTSKISAAGAEKLPFIYAEAGIWYDALEALSELIVRSPRDETLWRQRDALLAQSGLPTIPIGNPE